MTPDTTTLALQGVAITVAGGSSPDTEPLVGFGTDWGFACGNEALKLYGRPRDSDLRLLVQSLEALPTGQAVAFVEPPASTRPLVLIQSDRGAFYERHHRGWVRSWIDFYYAAAHLVFVGIEQRWAAESVHVDHPTHEPWLRNTSQAMLEALGHARAAESCHLCAKSSSTPAETSSPTARCATNSPNSRTTTRPSARSKFEALALDCVDPALAHVVAAPV